jgi:hypothetical protein
MAVHYRLRGADLTKRTQVVFVSGHVAETLRFLAKQARFESWVTDSQNWAVRVLVDAGHDRKDLTNEKALSSITHTVPEDSDEDFAARILRSIIRLREAIKQQRAERAAMEGIALGETITLHGIKVLRNRANRGGRPCSTSSRNRLMAEEYLRRRKSSKLPPTALKKKIGADRKFMAPINGKKTLGPSASVEAIDAGLKKLSGKVS